jgi:hypothetical protein
MITILCTVCANVQLQCSGMESGPPRGWKGKWGNLPQTPAMQGPPTDHIFIPNIYVGKSKSKGNLSVKLKQ